MSKPGYPTSSNTSYSYSSDYVDLAGNHYPGTNSGSLTTFYRDKSGANSIGWPKVKTENSYMTISTQVHPAGISYQFGGPSGNASGTDSALRKAYSTNPAGVVLDDSWSIIGNIYDQCLYKVHMRLIDQIKNQKVNVAQVFAEREQTARLVSSTARRLAEAFLHIRRGQFPRAITALTGSPGSRGLGRGLGGIPEQWLALQYGWKPLLQDVYGSCEELANHVAGVDRAPFVTFYSSAQVQSSGEFTIAREPSSGDCDWHIGYVAKARGKGSVKVTADDWLQAASSASRIGLTNPAQLAWELLPYSFVVDWFIPVGNFLSSIDYSSGLGFYSGWESMNVEIEWTGRPVNTSRYPVGFTSGSWSGGNFTAQTKYYQRLPLTGFPPVPLPRFKDPFSLTHVANSLSLLATAFSSKKGLVR